jgi:sterol 3beta-glucosyltransferase
MSTRAKGRTTALAVVCTGTRSDVLPYVALAAGLQRGGFKVKLVTHASLSDLAAANGLGFGALRGDPQAVMRTTAFREGVEQGNYLKLAGLFKREHDASIEPNMACIHAATKDQDGILCSITALTESLAIGQKYQIPVVLCPLLPFSPSGELPLATVLPEPLKYKFLNKLSYDLSGTLLWGVMGGTYNRFRTGTLGIGPQASYVLDGVPQVAGFSPVVVPPPADWGAHVHTTANWHLPEAAGMPTPASHPRLLALLSATEGSADPLARPIYMGFESTPLPDTIAFLRAVYAAATRLGVSVVFAAGDTDVAAVRNSPRLADLDQLAFELPAAEGGAAAAVATPLRAGVGQPRVLVVRSLPYLWAFRRCSVAVHHGGSGVTQAALEAGIPSVAFPAFGEQFFWGARVCALGAGPSQYYPLRQMLDTLEPCLAEARTPGVVARAAAIGAAMQASGDGVARAVATVKQVLSKPQARHCGVTCQWVADNTSDKCSICEALFTFTQRRHHCRSCGCLACGACVAQRCHLPGFPEDAPQLCCERCLDMRRAFFAMYLGQPVVPQGWPGAADLGPAPARADVGTGSGMANLAPSAPQGGAGGAATFATPAGKGRGEAAAAAGADDGEAPGFSTIDTDGLVTSPVAAYGASMGVGSAVKGRQPGAAGGAGGASSAMSPLPI